MMPSHSVPTLATSISRLALRVAVDLVLVPFFVAPILVVLAASFFGSDGFGGLTPGFTLANYIEVLHSALTLKLYLATIKFTVLTWIFTLIIGFFVAYFLVFHVRNQLLAIGLFLLCTVPFWTSNIIRMISWIPLLGKEGLINTALMRLGVIRQPLEVLLFSELAVVIAYVHQLTIFMAGVPLRQCEMWQPGGYPAKTTANGFDRQLQNDRGYRRAQHGDNRSGNPVGDGAAQQDCRHRGRREQRGWQRPGGSDRGQCLHSEPEFTGNFGQVEAKEVLGLSAGDQDGDAVSEPDHHRPGNKLHRSAHPGCAQDDEDCTRHQRAHIQAVDAMNRDDPGNYDHESAGRAADLSLRSAQRGDEKAGHDRAIDSRLRRQSGSDGESHS